MVVDEFSLSELVKLIRIFTVEYKYIPKFPTAVAAWIHAEFSCNSGRINSFHVFEKQKVNIFIALSYSSG